MGEDLVSLLAQESATAAKIIASVSPQQLTVETPCPDFTVRALINHMCMGNQFVSRVLGGEAALPDYERDFIGDDHVSAYERSRDDVLGAAGTPGVLDRLVPFPGAEVPGAFAVAFATLEAIVHRWDLARGIGADPDIDADVAAVVLERIRPMIVDDLRATAPDQTTPSIPFGPQVDVPENATGAELLLAFTGRTPSAAP